MADRFLPPAGATSRSYPDCPAVWAWAELLGLDVAVVPGGLRVSGAAVHLDALDGFVRVAGAVGFGRGGEG